MIPELWVWDLDVYQLGLHNAAIWLVTDFCSGHHLLEREGALMRGENGRNAVPKVLTMRLGITPSGSNPKFPMLWLHDYNHINSTPVSLSFHICKMGWRWNLILKDAFTCWHSSLIILMVSKSPLARLCKAMAILNKRGFITSLIRVIWNDEIKHVFRNTKKE